METYKATFIDFVRQELAKHPGAAERFLAQLSDEEQAKYRAVLPLSWLTPEFGSRLLEASAPILFPEAKDPVYELARRQARHDMNGIYRLLLKVATVPMVIERAAKVFATYHRRGTAEVKKVEGENRGTFLIHDYPELPRTIRVSVAGFTHGLLEMTGAKEIEVRIDESDPQHWRWAITWR